MQVFKNRNRIESVKVRSHQTRMIYMFSQCKDAIDNPAARFADIRAALTNQELALAVTSLRAEAENPKQQWRTK